MQANILNKRAKPRGTFLTKTEHVNNNQREACQISEELKCSAVKGKVVLKEEKRAPVLYTGASWLYAWICLEISLLQLKVSFI